MNRRSASYYLMTGSILVGSLLIAVPAQASGGSSAKASHAQRIPRVAYSVALEDQLLAFLRYLPVSFQPLVRTPTPPPTTTTTSTTSTTSTTTLPASSTTTAAPTTTTTVPTRKQRSVSPAVLRKGRYVWRFASLPGAFRSQWSVNTLNVILRGALMRFQSVHNLPATGSMDGTTWRTLVTAAVEHRYDPVGYDMVYVNQTVPQKLTLYQNGRPIFTSPVNTGISVSPTANGTFPVYLRYTTTTMSGTNPNGTTYHDTGIPWVSYFNGGDALHGFIRSSYGWPQSLGCVEMPFADAKVVWLRTPIGTLVTVR